MEKGKSGKRFEVLYEQEDKFKMDSYMHSRILKDLETGVLYLHSFTICGLSTVLLVDKDGKPLIDE